MKNQEQLLYEKKILFLCPEFFGYEKKILKKMMEMGARVDYFDERSIKSALDKALLKISPVFFYRRTNKYFKKIIIDNKYKQYDYIFIVKCDMISQSILKELKTNFKKAQLILYLYDSIENVCGIIPKLCFFDKCFSFDRKDSNNVSELQFQPLFFCDEYRKQNQEKKDFKIKKYDMCFIGTIHSDRYSVIKKVNAICQNMKLETYWYLYLQSKFIYYFYKITKPEFRSVKKELFSFLKLDAKAISNIIDFTDIVLDIQDPKQTGLTMRTIEMLGMKKKLITTNREIESYDFYNPQNILIIDRKNPVIPNAFIKTDYMMIDEDKYEKYSLEAWIKTVICESGKSI